MNNRNAFSHSEQCDQFFSRPAITHPGTGCLVSGFEQAHDKCRCWCHSALDLFSSPEPEYDLTPPPEYLSSADRAFAFDEPAHVRVGFSLTETSPPLGSFFGDYADTVVDTCGEVIHSTNYLIDQNEPDLTSNQPALNPVRNAIDIHEGPANKAGFSKWSRKELSSGKCDTCEDKLADCECVE